jgi:ABC-type antimicrobial peptide transport system permease subunit
MFLTQAAILGGVGVAVGVLAGWLLVSYYGKVGIIIAPEVLEAKATNMITYGKILYTQFSGLDALNLSITALVMILLVALYPASFAARLQPVESLHGK